MTAAHIAEMMKNWTKIEAAVMAQYPAADAEAVYEMTKAAMNKSLGLTA